MPKIKRYSMYDRKTDMPLLLYATAKECAEFMKVDQKTFYHTICRQRSGVHVYKKYEIFEDEVDDE